MANRGAVGARIHVTVQTKTGPRSIYRTVGSGGSFGANPLRQEIGLGDASIRGDRIAETIESLHLRPQPNQTLNLAVAM